LTFAETACSHFIDASEMEPATAEREAFGVSRAEL
jgi:hypothetical protein